MILENTEALRSWLTTCLVEAYGWDADPLALAKYVIALVKKKDRQEAELRVACLEQLEVFFGDKTQTFVDHVLSVIKSKEYLKPYAPKSGATTVTPSNAVPATSVAESVVTSSTSVANEKAALPVAASESSTEKKTKDQDERVRRRSRSRSPARFRNRSPPSHGLSSRRRSRSPAGSRRRHPGGRRTSPGDRRKRRSRSRSISPPRRSPVRRGSSRSPGRRSSPGRRLSRSPDRRRVLSRSPDRRRGSPRSPPLGRRVGSRSPVGGGRRSPIGGGRRSPRRMSRSRSRSPINGRGDGRSRDASKEDLMAEKENNANMALKAPSNRCRDYDERGFCMRGDLCPYDHGTDPLVVDDMSVLGFGLPGASGGAPMPPGVGQPPVLPPPAEPYNPEAPGIPRSAVTTALPPMNLAPGMMPPMQPGTVPPPSFFRTVPPPRMPIPPPTAQPTSVVQGGTTLQPLAPPQQRELVTVPIMTSHPAAVPRLPSVVMAPPTSTLSSAVSGMTTAVVGLDGRNSGLTLSNRGGGHSVPPYRGGGNYRGRFYNHHHHHNQSHFDRQERCELVVRKIPRHQNNIATLNAYFSKFGNVVNLQVCFEGDSESALVRFSSHAEANAAHRCTDAVLNNRFIRVFWHKPEAISGQQALLQQQQQQSASSNLGALRENNCVGIGQAANGRNGAVANQTHSMDDLDDPSTNHDAEGEPGSEAPPPGTEDVTLPSQRLSIKDRLGPKQPLYFPRHVVTQQELVVGQAQTSVDDPAAMETAIHAQPPVVNYKQDTLRKSNVLKKTKQEQEVEMQRKRVAMQKEKAQILEKYMAEFKVLREKLDTCKTDKEKASIMKMIKQLSGVMEKLRSTIASTVAPTTTVGHVDVASSQLKVSVHAMSNTDGAASIVDADAMSTNGMLSTPNAENASASTTVDAGSTATATPATPTTPTSPTVTAAQALAAGATKVGSLVKALPPPPVAKNEAEKELLDAEMDLYRELHQGGDTTQLKKRVEQLRRQARALGLLDAAGQWRGVARGRGILARPMGVVRGRGFFLGGRGLGRGRGRGGCVSVVDHRPRSILVKGILSQGEDSTTPVDDATRQRDKDALVEHFSQYCDEVENAEYVSDDPTAVLITFRTRKGAEIAIMQGATYRGTPLQWTWSRSQDTTATQSGDGSIPGITTNVANTVTSSGLPAKSDGEVTVPEEAIVDEDIASSAGAPEDVDDILLNDDEEDEDEGRSWRR